MRIRPVPPLLTLLSLLHPILATTTTRTTTTATTSLTLLVPPSPQLPHPELLPADTHATLTTLGARHAAPLTTTHTFVFRNLTPGSYLAEVHCRTHAVAPLRVDVSALDSDPSPASLLQARAWETARGADWDHRGAELVRTGAFGAFPVRVLGPKQYFIERGSFSVLGLLRNPMILLGLISMLLFLGLPKLMENMDPEMKAEWEESQKNNPMNSIMAGGQPGASPIANFDMAAYLAGAVKNHEGGDSSATTGYKADNK